VSTRCCTGAVLQTLLDHCVNVDALDMTSITPLQHYASREGHVDIVRTLLENVVSFDQSSPSALAHAISFGQAVVATILLRHEFYHGDVKTAEAATTISDDD
jgi:ankyrin repeat protein